MPKLLLHACCGPCTTIPLDLLQGEGYDVCVAFINPNIHPQTEYVKRFDTLTAYLANKNVELYEGAYNMELWQQRVGVYGGPYSLLSATADTQTALSARRQRCKMCYRMRLEEAADLAQKVGATHIATTLSISPYQFSDLINTELTVAARQYSLMPLIRDYREQYHQSINVARAAGLYRQNYCGCYYSEQEAAIEREARKIAREAAAQC